MLPIKLQFDVNPDIIYFCKARFFLYVVLFLNPVGSEQWYWVPISFLERTVQKTEEGHSRESSWPPHVTDPFCPLVIFHH